MLGGLLDAKCLASPLGCLATVGPTMGTNFVSWVFSFEHWAQRNVKARQLADVEIFCLFTPLFSQVMDAE